MADSSFPPSAPENHPVTDRQLRWGLWFLAHRQLLRRVGYGLLIAVSVASWGYTLWGFADYYLMSGVRFERELRALASRANPRAAVIERQRPMPIEIAEVLLIPNANGSYDAAARLVNANPRWRVAAEYALDIPGAPEEVARTVVPPGGERWVVRLNARSSAAPSAATLTLRALQWDRIPWTEAPDIARFMGERVAVTVRDAAVVPPTDAAVGGIAITRARFTAVNTGAYGLRELEFVVLARRGGMIVAVNRTTMSDFRSGETRGVAATWFHPIGLVTGVEVHAFADAFDPHAFLPP